MQMRWVVVIGVLSAVVLVVSLVYAQPSLSAQGLGGPSGALVAAPRFQIVNAWDISLGGAMQGCFLLDTQTGRVWLWSGHKGLDWRLTAVDAPPLDMQAPAAFPAR